MKQDIEKTKVIFRKFKPSVYKGEKLPFNWQEDLIAYFPEILGDYNANTCQNYQHYGQHGHGLATALSNTLPVDKYEATPLIKELEEIGYNLEIIKRFTRKHFLARQAELKQI